MESTPVHGLLRLGENRLLAPLALRPAQTLPTLGWGRLGFRGWGGGRCSPAPAPGPADAPAKARAASGGWAVANEWGRAVFRASLPELGSSPGAQAPAEGGRRPGVGPPQFPPLSNGDKMLRRVGMCDLRSGSSGSCTPWEPLRVACTPALWPHLLPSVRPCPCPRACPKSPRVRIGFEPLPCIGEETEAHREGVEVTRPKMATLERESDPISPSPRPCLMCGVPATPEAAEEVQAGGRRGPPPPFCTHTWLFTMCVCFSSGKTVLFCGY